MTPETTPCNPLAPPHPLQRAETALDASEHVLGVDAPPIGKRDTRRVRGLAAYILKHDSGRWSWPDVCEALYGHRTGHATAVGSASPWAGTWQARVALERYRVKMGKEATGD